MSIRPDAQSAPRAASRSGELDRTTGVFGLATASGVVSSTGIAGLILGGGLGWLMGRYGMAIDNLLATEVVLASGEVVTASDDDNPDLFWAIRGGGGNFGVVTSFELQAHPVESVLSGPVLYVLDAAPSLLSFYRDFCADLPDELRDPGRFPARARRLWHEALRGRDLPLRNGPRSGRCRRRRAARVWIPSRRHDSAGALPGREHPR